ncbi:MAG TPA: hypothetical protein VIL88_09570 [Devosia sp.]|jgi:hypothetical protein|uniref:hypothetical protein n=1 Tax=Devosia sp. TaxID=1871048 RepID=UPI002F92661E
MLKELLRFYWMCIRRAFSGKFWKAERLSGGLSVLAGLFALFWPINREGDKLVASLPLWFFLTIFVATVLFGLIVAPYHLYHEERQKARLLEQRQEPHFKVSLEGDKPFHLLEGTTTTSLAGTRQSVSRRGYQVVGLLCENTGLDSLWPCSAKLMAAWRKGPEGMKRLEVYEAIELSWSSDLSRPSFAEQLDAGERKRIFISLVHPNGCMWVFREAHGLPFEYQQIFGQAGTYQMLIQLKSSRPDPYHVLVQVETWEEPRTIPGIAWAGSKVTILAQGAPPLSQPGIAA